MKYILAHDFGTSADKAVLFSTEGQLIASSSASYPSFHFAEESAEQDPEDWWRAFCRNNEVLLQEVSRQDILCVSFDGTAPNCLCADAEQRPLHYAMIWQDNRAKRQAVSLTDSLPAEYLMQHPGRKISTDRMLPKLLWVRENLPDIYRKTRYVLPSAHGYVILKLTGRNVCDYGVGGATAMMNLAGTGWSEEILQLAGIPREILPELLDRTETAGTVTEQAAAECGLAAGTPVVAGTIDNQCTAVGTGICRPGDVFLCSGTSASIEGFDLQGSRIGRATAASGASFEWLKNEICLLEKRDAQERGENVYEIMDREIAEAPAGSNGVIFHPYLAGARSTLSNPDAKGSFFGITLGTTRNDLMRSVVEGIGFDLNLILEMLRDHGLKITKMPIVGGLGKGAVVRQIFADIMNVELITFQNGDAAAATGAAVLGGIAAGVFPDVSAARNFLRVETRTVPNPENYETYCSGMVLYSEIYRQLLPIYSGGADLTGHRLAPRAI